MGKYRARVFTPLGLVVLLTCVGGALMLDLSAYSLSGCSYADGLCDVDVVKSMEAVGTRSGRCTMKVLIADCGELKSKAM